MVICRLTLVFLKYCLCYKKENAGEGEEIKRKIILTCEISSNPCLLTQCHTQLQ